MEPTTRFRALRLLHNLDQVAAGQLLGVSASQYSKIERGDSIADATKLQVLAEHYGVFIDYLLGRSADPGAPADTSLLPPPDPMREGLMAEYDRLDLINRRLLYGLAMALRQAQEQRELLK